MLRAKYDETLAILQFFGDTYNAKDDIKLLGKARWRGDIKCWKVSVPANTELSSLLAKFPHEVKIEQSSTVQAENSSVPALSVFELNLKLQAAIHQAFPGTILLKAIVSSVKRQTNRAFIEIRDELDATCEMSCMATTDMQKFFDAYEKIGFPLDLDLNVLFSVQVSIAGSGGRVLLKIIEVFPEYTLGKAQQARELTNERLKKEGLFELNRNKRLPVLPIRLAVLTSKSGTVINDFLSSLEVARFGFEVIWRHIPVQGHSAERAIVEALRSFACNTEEHQVDAIILIRGGGSAGDLSIFNSYEIAKAICLADIPVLTAIGHQADQSSAQDVSYQAFGVPKDIGRFLADIILNLRKELEQRVLQVRNLSTEIINYWQQRLQSLSALALARSASIPDRAQLQLQQLSSKAGMLAQQLVLEKIQWTEQRSQLLDLSSPQRQLERGFILCRQNGRLVKSLSAADYENPLELQFKDKVAKAKLL